MKGIDNKDALIMAASIGAGAAAALALTRGHKPQMRGWVAVITGGSRGLGVSLAREFAAEGCRIAICARNRAELAAARADLERRGAEVLAVECDVADREQVDSLVARVLAHYGRVDVLVNNAGNIQVGPLESMTLEDFENAMQVMFWGTVYPTLALLPHFTGRGRKAEDPEPRIVNITSIGGKVAVPHLLPYTCAKFAAVGFSEGLRPELADKGVKVVTIAPGLMRTGSFLNAFFKGDQEREASWFGVSASLPGLSISGSRAARQVVAATRRGDAEKILSTPANLLARFHGVFPGVTSELLGVVSRVLLPSGSDKEARRGRDTAALQSGLLSALTIFGRMAARRFLQEPAGRPVA
jgi:NAD(P)-dependent dehydrogenase (short-subunit alcohol dehydrogenase family)